MGGKNMNAAKRKRLEKAGWKIGTAKEFLGLSDAEWTLIEVKLALGAKLREYRTAHAISQGTLAARLGSSQSRVAKMEKGDASVSIDLLVRALLATGASRKEVAKAIGAGA
jgi:DNA-binding XRE family transcriptional regulator